MNRLTRFLEQEGAVTRSTAGQFSVSVFKRANEQVVFDESNETTRVIMEELCSLASDGFGAALDDDQREGARSHIQNVDALFLLHDDSRVFGFASALFPREEFVYLHGVVLSSAAKGKGGAGLLVQSLLDVCECPDMAFTTQNPVMFCLLRSMCRAVYPSPEFEEVPERFHSRVLRLVGAGSHSDVFNPKTGIRPNLFSQCLYPQIPTSKDLVVNEWFSKKLEIENGQTRHGFLFIGEGLLR